MHVIFYTITVWQKHIVQTVSVKIKPCLEMYGNTKWDRSFSFICPVLVQSYTEQVTDKY